MADLSFPWELFLKAQESKNRNQQEMNQNIAGLGQGLGQGIGAIGEAIQQKKRQQVLQQLIQQMNTQGAPQQGPPMAPAGTPQPQSMYTVPPGQPMSAGGNNIGQDVQMPQPIPTQGLGQPSSGIGAPPQDNSQKIQALMMQLYPDIAVPAYMKQQDPMERLRMERLRQLVSGGQGGGGIGKPNVGYVDDEGNFYLDERPGTKPVTAQQAQYMAVTKSTKEKNKAMTSRSEAWERSIDTRQIDQLIQRTGLTSKQQSVVQMNNLRSARAISILNQPNITWQELALGEIDLTGIMQGGVPVRDELVATHFPGWQERVARWKTYATGHPTENVPPDIKNKVKSMIQGVIGVDNTILKSNAKFAKSMLGPTIRGGLTSQQNKSINEMTSVLGTEGMTQPPAQADPLGIR